MFTKTWESSVSCVSLDNYSTKSLVLRGRSTRMTSCGPLWKFETQFFQITRNSTELTTNPPATPAWIHHNTQCTGKKRNAGNRAGTRVPSWNFSPVQSPPPPIKCVPLPPTTNSGFPDTDGARRVYELSTRHYVIMIICDGSFAFPRLIIPPFAAARTWCVYGKSRRAPQGRTDARQLRKLRACTYSETDIAVRLVRIWYHRRNNGAKL